ncbi:hypothetical protein JCM8547_001504 [Rhodosporidiobolus lusitaniae]
MSSAARPPRRSTRASIASATSSPSLSFSLKATKRAFVGAEEPSKQEEGVKQKGDKRAPAKKQKRARVKAKADYSHLLADPLTDRIKPGLLALACGENPGIATATLQLHYASPTNHFYRCLHAAGLTPTVLPPTASTTIHEDHNVGITNLIPRPTREASELTKTELAAAVPVFLAKVAKFRPKVVFFVGMKVADTVLAYFHHRQAAFSSGPPAATTSSSSASTSSTASPALTASPSSVKASSKPKKALPVKAQIGWLPFALSHPPSPSTTTSSSGSASVLKCEATYFYCLPSTSGRVAAYPLPVKLKIWTAFGQEVDKLRKDPPEVLDLLDDLVVVKAEELDLPEMAVKVENGGAMEVNVSDEVVVQIEQGAVQGEDVKVEVKEE